MKTTEKQLTVEEMSSDIRNIINESYQEHNSPDATERFSISEYVNRLLSTVRTNQKLTNYLMHMNERIEHGAKQFMIFEEFGKGLEQFSDIIEVRNVLDEMNKTLQEGDNANILESFKISEMVADEYVHEQLVEALNAYFATPNDITRKQVQDAIDNMHNLNETQMAINLQLIIEGLKTAHAESFSSVSLNETANIIKKQQSARDEQIQKNIFEKVERYIQNRMNEEEINRKKIDEQFNLKNISNKMGLQRSISGLLKSEFCTKNDRLVEKLNQFAYALQQGCYEERVYESFLTQMQPFNYIKDVEKVIKRINEKAGENPDTLLLTRILEEMSESADSYIYREMIEEDVCRFIMQPSPENRIQVLNACMPYATNPFINKILETIYRISDKRFTGSISEQAMSIKDQIQMIKENVSVYNLYSPVLYIKENQSVFAVGNTFYLKTGNTVAPLDKKYIPKLDEKFVQLAHLVNNPAVTVQDDRIYLAGEDMWATVFEDRVVISDGHGEYTESQESLRKLDEMCMKYNTYGNTEFFIMASCLVENFNNIATVGFAKKVVMNGNEDVSCELFRLDENIFLATHNYQLHQNTFYRNVNPIFARKTINEHFGINVGQLFEDLLPNQSKLIMQLFETKNEYEKSIEEYEQMIQDLNDAKDNANTTEMEKELDTAIAEAKEKLEEVKKEYREWQDEADETLEGTKDDDAAEDDEDNVTREVNNEPLDKDEVKDHEDELSEPLSNTDAETDAAPAEEAGAEVPVVTDDEFSEYMAQDATDDTVNPDEMPEEETETDDEAEFVDGDIFDETPKEEVSDEEDIITTEPVADTDEEVFDEEPSDDMEIRDSEGNVVADAGTEATDLFGGDTEHPIDGMEEPEVGTPAVAGGEATPELFNPGTQTSEFNIVNVMFDENVKENTLMKSGQVLALKPMVDADGRKYVEETVVKFYMNDDNTPVIEADSAMSTVMYNAIIDAIKAAPMYSEVCSRGVNVTTGSDAPVADDVATVTPDETATDDNWEEEYLQDGNAEDRSAVLPATAEEPVVADTVTDVVTDEPVADEPAALPEPDADDLDNFDLDDLFTDEEPAATEEVPAPAAEETPAETVSTDVVETPEETVTDVVDTYTDPDGTEIEVPAPAADEKPAEEPAAAEDGVETPEEGDDEESDEEKEDDSIIPENHTRQVTKEQINENRKSILSVKSKIK